MAISREEKNRRALAYYHATKKLVGKKPRTNKTPEERKARERELNLIRAKRYYAENPDKFRARQKAYRDKDLEKRRAYCRAMYKKHRTKALANKKEYQQREATRIAAYNKAYLAKNRERVNTLVRERSKKRRATDPQYKISLTLRARVTRAVTEQYVTKADKTMALIGCDVAFLIRHLESKFLLGMTWENHGRGIDKWHIDHMLPCNSFNLQDPEQQKACFNWKNLQPLWCRDNIIKGDKIPSLPQAA